MTGKLQRRYWVWLVAASTIFVGIYVSKGFLLTRVARFLDVSDEPKRVDAVMVLGGGNETRPFVAAAMVRRRLADRALVPTVKLSRDNLDGISTPEHEVIYRVLQLRGVEDERITLLPGDSASTLDEARALGRYLDEHPQTTVAVVTHDYHTRRARMLFNRILAAREERIQFVAAPNDLFSQDNWWQTESGVSAYTNEYPKLILYTLRLAG